MYDLEETYNVFNFKTVVVSFCISLVVTTIVLSPLLLSLIG